MTEKRSSSDSRPATVIGVDQEKTTTARADVPEPTIEGSDTLPNGVGPASNGVEPIRDGKGANIIGPRNYDREAQSVGLVRPPPTDKGTLPSFKWSFADSHIRIEEGGWARQATIREIPTSIELAGVNMRLEEGVIRELHWHKEAECMSFIFYPKYFSCNYNCSSQGRTCLKVAVVLHASTLRVAHMRQI
jgi:hypothetical protein